MSVTREDVLRELELLPVWKLNPTHTAVHILQALEPVAVNAESATLMQALEPVPVMSAASIDAPVADNIETPAEPPLEKIAVTWLLYCPLTESNIEAPANADALILLKNMINAMQLLSTDYQLVHDEKMLIRYQPQRTLLFGLTAANNFLKTQATDIEGLGSQPVFHAQSDCWVIDHPADLLQTPMRKRHAWQIMCEAKAYARQENTSL